MTVLNLARPFAGKKEAAEGGHCQKNSQNSICIQNVGQRLDGMAVVRSVALVGQRRKR